jgi:hypothetical protein
MPDLWEKFDTQHQYFSEYNRYANITFKSSSTDKIRFHSSYPDQLFVYIDPSSDVLNKMGVTHILALDEDIAAFENNKKFKKLWENSSKAIYKVNEN